MKLTLYLLFGSAFILVGIFALYVGAGRRRRSRSSSWRPTHVRPRAAVAGSSSPSTSGFGILAGIWPLHTWSPDGHASAPTRSRCSTPAC